MLLSNDGIYFDSVWSLIQRVDDILLFRYGIYHLPPYYCEFGLSCNRFMACLAFKRKTSTVVIAQLRGSCQTVLKPVLQKLEKIPLSFKCINVLEMLQLINIIYLTTNVQEAFPFHKLFSIINTVAYLSLVYPGKMLFTYSIV